MSSESLYLSWPMMREFLQIIAVFGPIKVSVLDETNEYCFSSESTWCELISKVGESQTWEMHVSLLGKAHPVPIQSIRFHFPNKTVNVTHSLSAPRIDTVSELNNALGIGVIAEAEVPV